MPRLNLSNLSCFPKAEPSSPRLSASREEQSSAPAQRPTGEIPAIHITGRRSASLFRFTRENFPSAPGGTPSRSQREQVQPEQVRRPDSGSWTARLKSHRPFSWLNRGRSSELILQVPYIAQTDNGCWYASFNMLGRYHGRPDTDYSDMPALFENGVYKFISDRASMQAVLHREGLLAVPGCNQRGREFTASELVGLLQNRGPIAFAWQNPNVQLFQDQPGRHHWSVIVGANPNTGEITYHNPIPRSEEVDRPRTDRMTIDQFNQWRMRNFPNSMLQSTLG